MMGNESEGTAKQKKKVGNSVTDFFLICLSSF